MWRKVVVEKCIWDKALLSLPFDSALVSPILKYISLAPEQYLPLPHCCVLSALFANDSKFSLSNYCAAGPCVEMGISRGRWVNAVMWPRWTWKYFWGYIDIVGPFEFSTAHLKFRTDDGKGNSCFFFSETVTGRKQITLRCPFLLTASSFKISIALTNLSVVVIVKICSWSYTVLSALEGFYVTKKSF